MSGRVEFNKYRKQMMTAARKKPMAEEGGGKK